MKDMTTVFLDSEGNRISVLPSTPPGSVWLIFDPDMSSRDHGRLLENRHCDTLIAAIAKCRAGEAKEVALVDPHEQADPHPMPEPVKQTALAMVRAISEVHSGDAKEAAAIALAMLVAIAKGDVPGVAWREA